MKSDTVLIFAGEKTCHVAVNGRAGQREMEIAIGAESSPDLIADKIVGAMQKLGAAGVPSILALPSEWCLAARIATDGLPRKNRRQPMVYRLENKFPVAAEDLAIDFFPEDPTGFALGIAVETRYVLPLAAALESHGVMIQNICPAALLALQIQLARDTAASVDAILWGDVNHLEVFILHEGRPSHWYVLARDAADLNMHLDLHAARLQRPLRVSCSHVDSAVLESLSNHALVSVAHVDQRTIREVAAGALEKGTRIEIDLLRDGLATGDPLHAVRKPLLWAATSAGILVLAIIACICWRAGRYNRLAADYEMRQAEIFRRVLPGRSLPASVKSRLVSEERGLTGVSGNASDLPVRPSAIGLLHDVLMALPMESRYRVRELRLGEGRIYIEGDARSHGEADAVAAALRQNPGFQIDAPQTDQAVDKTVNFAINGTVAAPPKRAKSPAGDSRTGEP